MSKQYCFDIENPDNVSFNPEDLKTYIRGLYIGRAKDKYNKDDPPPFVRSESLVLNLFGISSY